MFAFVFAIGVSLASQALRANLPNMEKIKVPVFGEAISRIGADWMQLLVFMAAGIALLLFKTKPTSAVSNEKERDFTIPALFSCAIICLALAIADLFLVGIRINPTAPPSSVYPVTPGIKLAQDAIGHDHIFPVNKFGT